MDISRDKGSIFNCRKKNMQNHWSLSGYSDPIKCNSLPQINSQHAAIAFVKNHYFMQPGKSNKNLTSSTNWFESCIHWGH